MESIIVTGAAGLFGAHMSRHLLNKGYRVIGIDNLEGGYKDFLPTHENFAFELMDLGETQRLREVFVSTTPKAVFHFAAYAAEGLSPFIRRFNYDNNLMASSSVVNNAIESDAKVIFTSSMAVYGNQNPPFDEAMLPSPSDPYGIAKFAVELDLANAKDQFGLRYSIVRPHNVVGVFQNVWDRYRNVLGIFIRQALSGQNLSVYGDGSQVRAFSDISYYLEPLEKLIDSFDGETFNVGADKETTILELARFVVDEAAKRGIEASMEFLEARHEVQFAYCNHDKAKRVLDFEDRTDLKNLIASMFDWVSNQPTRKVRNMEYEITKGLYSFWAN